MLTPRLTDCPECANIPNLLKKIDCKLAEYANGLYNNVVFMLNQVVPAGAMIQLLAYKRILTYKQCNPDYLSDFCIDKIISKVIRLTLGCDIKPVFTPIPTTSTTSTSTTCPPLNCSFDGTGVSSCSFTGTANKITIPPTTTTSTTLPITTSTTSSTSTSTTSSTSSTSTSSSTTTTTTTVAATYCTNWTAANDGNIKMQTVGYIDFSAILAGRTISTGLSVGTITGYIIAGVGTFTCSVPMTFTTSQAQWNTDSLPVVTDKVLTSLICNVEVIFTNSDEYSIVDGQTNAIVIPGQMTSEYNDCPV